VAAGLGAGFGHVLPAVQARGARQQVLKRPAETQFVLHPLGSKIREGAVVFVDQRGSR
jgi:hypothetical protein